MRMIDWKRRKYSQEEFKDAWLSSDSIAECARKLDLTIYGSTYISLKDAATELGLNTEHMVGQNWWNADNRPPPKQARPLEDLLVEDIRVGSHKLKERLIRAGYFKAECAGCGLSTWKNFLTGAEEPIKLALDHIDGNNRNNLITNLRLLCYNCHGVTPTFCRGKNGPKQVPSTTPTLCIYCSRPCHRSVYWHADCLTCIDCGNKASTLRCKSCDGKSKIGKNTRIEWPGLDALIKMINETNYLATGRALGVSDNAVRKRIKSAGLDPKKLPV